MDSELCLTVAIPTHNGAERLPQVLDRLKLQQFPDSLRWEVLVVDNASCDRTAAIVRTYQTTWIAGILLRYCFEPRQGIAFARQKAVEQAQGDWVGFLDDDNWPAVSWVAAAAQFAQQHPQAGAFGGQIHAHFDQAPPPNFERIQSFFAIRERGPEAHRYQPQMLALPPGAGLVIQRHAWLTAVPSQLQHAGRGGNDFEALLYLHRASWEIWYAPSLEIDHHIPDARLQPESMHPLLRQASFCIYRLRLIGITHWQVPLLFVRLVAGGLKRALYHAVKYRLRVWQDPMLAYELAFYLYSAFSPFYCLWQSIPNFSLSAAISTAQTT
ncbi:MAG: hormogonium polysaccharide biosynthesis glycosyltransferase HpsE [Cyanobacteria bacterium J06626_23]